jgi:hypothetical protein
LAKIRIRINILKEAKKRRKLWYLLNLLYIFLIFIISVNEIK